MTRIFAHRGSCAYAPENTIPSFELAIAQGAEAVEFDVHLTADEEPVIIHDETLERTTDGTGWVKDHDLSSLRKLNANAHFDAVQAQVPTLAEVLETIAPTTMYINIELKNSIVDYLGLEQKVLDTVASFGLEERVVLSSFNHYSLRRLQQLGTTIELAALFTDPIYRPWDYSKNLQVAAIHPDLLHITDQQFVADTHAAGLTIRPWVVNEPDDIHRMISWGVDGLFTDAPDIALAVKSEFAN